MVAGPAENSKTRATLALSFPLKFALSLLLRVPSSSRCTQLHSPPPPLPYDSARRALFLSLPFPSLLSFRNQQVGLRTAQLGNVQAEAACSRDKLLVSIRSPTLSTPDFSVHEAFARSARRDFRWGPTLSSLFFSLPLLHYLTPFSPLVFFSFFLTTSSNPNKVL